MPRVNLRCLGYLSPVPLVLKFCASGESSVDFLGHFFVPLVLNVCALGESSVPSVCLTVTACPSMLSLVSPRYDEEMTDTLVSGRGRRTLGFCTGGAKIGTLVAYKEFNTVPGAANHLLNLRTGMHVKLASGREGTLARLIGGQLKVATVGHGLGLGSWMGGGGGVG